MTQISKEKKKEYNKAYREKKKKEQESKSNTHEKIIINEIETPDEEIKPQPKPQPKPKTTPKPKPKVEEVEESEDEDEGIDLDEYIEMVVQQRLKDEMQKKKVVKKPKTQTNADGIQWKRMMQQIATGTTISMAPIVLKTLYSYYQTYQLSAQTGLRERSAQQLGTSLPRPNNVSNQMYQHGTQQPGLSSNSLPFVS